MSGVAGALPVVIVGGGPVGLTAAIDLQRRGVPPIVLEAKPEITWSSRAICISRRSLEIYDRLRVPAIAAKGLGWHRGQSYWRRHKVFDLALAHGPGDRHPPFVNLQQFYTEQFLADVFVEAGGALRWNARVTGLEQRDGKVTLEVDHDGKRSRIDAAYVIACDGARSTVREALGLALEGTSYEGRYLIADIEIESDRAVERRVWFDPPSNPGSTVIIHVQPDHIWRVDYQLRDDEDPDEALREDNVIARIRSHLAMIGEHAPWRLHWRSLYRAHCLTLADYVHGRVLFAGDAAHLVPIFGVRGLNSGIEDAHNLAWKVAAAQQGRAGPALLASYSDERRAATLVNIAQATKSTWFMSPPTNGFRLMRDAALQLAARHEFVRPLVNPRQSAPFAYGGSPLSTTGAAHDDAFAPGAPLPNRRTDSGSGWLHDALSPNGFTLLVGGSVAADGRERLRRWTSDTDGQVKYVEAPVEGAILVRPDEHIAANMAAPGVGDVAAAFQRALGGAPPTAERLRA